MSQASQPDSDESGEDDWLEDFADRPVEDLRKDVGLCQADKDQANELDEIEHDRLKQANALRQKFFYFGVGITIGCVVTSCFVSIALVFRGEMTPGIDPRNRHGLHHRTDSRSDRHHSDHRQVSLPGEPTELTKHTRMSRLRADPPFSAEPFP